MQQIFTQQSNTNITNEDTTANAYGTSDLKNMRNLNDSIPEPQQIAPQPSEDLKDMTKPIAQNDQICDMIETSNLRVTGSVEHLIDTASNKTDEKRRSTPELTTDPSKLSKLNGFTEPA